MSLSNSYPNIVKGANRLKASAIFYVVVAAIMIIPIPAITIIQPTLMILNQRIEPSLILILAAITLPIIFCGILLISAAVWYRMAAELALAQRDIAINSFRTANLLRDQSGT